jgi:hypothetical protein
MADPRSKPKTAKTKKSKAPHVLQQQAKLNTAQVSTKPAVQRPQGRGR